MKHTFLAIILSILAACKPAPTTSMATSPVEGSVPTEKLPRSEEEQFYSLTTATKDAFNSGKYEEAKRLANELQKLEPQYTKNWNYGNAVQNSNLVLGRLALRNGDRDDAKKYLLAAGQSPGSPQMNSFGPNMSLAKDLIEKGEKHTVTEYFTLCRSFWKMDHGQLDRWTKEVQEGKAPDFGANLLY